MAPESLPSMNMDIKMSPTSMKDLSELVDFNLLAYCPELITRFTFR
jgi:hypothetical protein